MEQEPDVIIEVADTHLYDNGTAEFYGYSIPEILRIAYFCQENEPTLFAATVDDWLEIPAAVYADTCYYEEDVMNSIALYAINTLLGAIMRGLGKSTNANRL